MLGGIKVKGDEPNAGAPLFRVLARRWKSLTPRKRERSALPSMASTDEPPKAARAWIAKPRQLYAHEKIEQPKPSSRWNPWLWMK
jgi:hypothetical protein